MHPSGILRDGSNLTNSAYQENSKSQKNATENIAVQRNGRTQNAASSSKIPNNNSKTTLSSSTPLIDVFTNIKNIYHSNVSSNSVSTNGDIV